MALTLLSSALAQARNNGNQVDEDLELGDVSIKSWLASSSCRNAPASGAELWNLLAHARSLRIRRQRRSFGSLQYKIGIEFWRLRRAVDDRDRVPDRRLHALKPF